MRARRAAEGVDQGFLPGPGGEENLRIQFVLEAAPDYFTRNGFGPGTLIATDRGGLAQTLAPLAQLQ